MMSFLSRIKEILDTVQDLTPVIGSISELVHEIRDALLDGGDRPSIHERLDTIEANQERLFEEVQRNRNMLPDVEPIDE